MHDNHFERLVPATRAFTNVWLVHLPRNLLHHNDSSSNGSYDEIFGFDVEPVVGTVDGGRAETNKIEHSKRGRRMIVGRIIARYNC